MKREKCALCGRYYPIPGAVAAIDECPGSSCWADAIKRLAEVGLTEKNTKKETNR